MARLDPLPVEQLSPQQKLIHDKIKGNRPKLGGPFGVLLRNPALATAASGVVDALRGEGKLDKRIYELIVLTVARHWSAQYAWAVHEPIARGLGFAPTKWSRRSRPRRTPTSAKPEEALVYDAVTELMAGKVLSTATYDRLIKQFGLDVTIELISTAGLYSMISTVLNGFDVPTANGEKPFLTILHSRVLVCREPSPSWLEVRGRRQMAKTRKRLAHVRQSIGHRAPITLEDQRQLPRLQAGGDRQSGEDRQPRASRWPALPSCQTTNTAWISEARCAAGTAWRRTQPGSRACQR